MRRFAALLTCLALIWGYFLAPFQHIHADHDGPVVAHTHLYAEFETHHPVSGLAFDDVDDHASVRTLDTFTLTLAASIQPFVLTIGPVIPAPRVCTTAHAGVVEECAHDPPSFRSTAPRAPPA